MLICGLSLRNVWKLPFCTFQSAELPAEDYTEGHVGEPLGPLCGLSHSIR